MFYKTPGVYVEEAPLAPSGVKEVETALPAFIGYTEKAQEGGRDLSLKPRRIRSLQDFQSYFGGAGALKRLEVTLNSLNQPIVVEIAQNYVLYDSLRLFFANGGTSCYVVSVGAYRSDGKVDKAQMLAGLRALEQDDEPALLVMPDAAKLGGRSMIELQKAALEQSLSRGDRFCIFDLDESAGLAVGVSNLRNHIGLDGLAFGAAYGPHLQTRLAVDFHFPELSLRKAGQPVSLSAVIRDAGMNDQLAQRLDQAVEVGAPRNKIDRLAQRLELSSPIYARIAHAVRAAGITLPPSGAVAGVYARVDAAVGVWKAPANVVLREVVQPSIAINRSVQQGLYIDAIGGKSVNLIRRFPARGNLVWGARTLAGNDLQWRYVAVRRVANVVEESVRKSTAWAVFEPNDNPLWVRLKAVIEAYLTEKWRAGMLKGAKRREAFYVAVGRGLTMTDSDIASGRLIVEFGIAVTKPAEFLTIRVTHQMQLR